MMASLWRRLTSWPGRLERIPGKWESEIRAFKPLYPDRSALQAVLDDASDTSVTSVAAERSLDPRRVFEFLGASLVQSAAPLTRGWLSQHLADLFLIAGIGILLMLATLGPNSDSGKKAMSANQAATTPHAIATRDLQPYVALQPQDLEAKNTKSDDEKHNLLSGFIGRAPLKVIRAGQTISVDQFIDKKIILTESSIVTVALKLRPALESHTLPASAELLFSNRGTPPSGEVFSVVLLSLDTDGLTATVAVPEVRLCNVAKWIGNSDVYVSFSTR
jgi:hypothetical protein